MNRGCMLRPFYFNKCSNILLHKALSAPSIHARALKDFVTSIVVLEQTIWSCFSFFASPDADVYKITFWFYSHSKRTNETFCPIFAENTKQIKGHVQSLSVQRKVKESGLSNEQGYRFNQNKPSGVQHSQVLNEFSTADCLQ